MQSLRNRCAVFLAGLVVLAGLVGCGGRADGTSPAPPASSELVLGGTGLGPEAEVQAQGQGDSQGGVAAPVTLVPAGRFYVTAEDRLVLPTLTPRPVVSELSPVLEDREPAAAAPVVVSGNAPVTLEERMDLERFFALSKPPCLEDFRAMLTGYEGPEKFGPEVARRLSARFLERREDCVASGWDPKFSLDPVCQTDRVQHGRIPLTLVDRDLRGRPVARPTASDFFGMILVHFERFPFVDEGGCWFYDGGNLRWYWQRWDLAVSSESRSVRGVDLPRFPGCEEYLRYLIEVEVVNKGSWDSLGVARLISRVMESAGEECGGTNSEGYAYWSLHPTTEAQPGCEVVQETGSWFEGTGVVNWVTGHTDADGNPCWVLRAGEGWYLGEVRAPLLSGLALPRGGAEEPNDDAVEDRDGEAVLEPTVLPVPEVTVEPALQPTVVPASGVVVGPGGTLGPVGESLGGGEEESGEGADGPGGEDE